MSQNSPNYILGFIGLMVLFAIGFFLSRLLISLIVYLFWPVVGAIIIGLIIYQINGHNIWTGKNKNDKEE